MKLLAIRAVALIGALTLLTIRLSAPQARAMCEPPPRRPFTATEFSV